MSNQVYSNGQSKYITTSDVVYYRQTTSQSLVAQTLTIIGNLANPDNSPYFSVENGDTLVCQQPGLYSFCGTVQTQTNAQPNAFVVFLQPYIKSGSPRLSQVNYSGAIQPANPGIESISCNAVLSLIPGQKIQLVVQSSLVNLTVSLAENASVCTGFIIQKIY